MLVLAGVLYPLAQKLGLVRLPGDIVIERESYRVYIPIGTSLAIGLVLTLVFWLLNR